MNNDKVQSTGYDPQYHDRQFVEPYQSTISFCDWLVSLGAVDKGNKKICDLGCGKGANLYYMSRRFSNCHFVGLDIDEQLIQDGSDFFARSQVSNCQLKVGDLYKAGLYFGSGEFDGVICLQTLSWLPGFEGAIDAITSLSPKWLALTSLFFDGPIEAKTVITQFALNKVNKPLYYNTYSIPLMRNYLFDLGYKKFEYRRFEMPVDLPRNLEGKMGTYTERTEDGRRLQISGPLLMNWYFIYAIKE